MSLRHTMRRLSVDELLERAASIANLAMLREYAEPSPIQIAAINEYTPLLKSKLRLLPPHDVFTRDRILAQLDIHRSILAPVRRLPPELLSEILLRVAKKTPLRTLHVAVTFSSVCVTWRKVARGHGALWTKVVAETQHDIDRYCELFLPLAKDIPIELRCDNRETLSSCWDSIAPYASRWRRITLEGRLCMMPDLKVLYMENLERLAVDAYGTPTSAELSVLDFVVAPHLCHVTLTLDALQSERQLHIPIARALTSLEIDVMTPFPVIYTLPLLRACADTLQSLALKVRHPLDGPDGSYPTSASDTFDMKALSKLRLVDPACALLNHISAPLIEVLILSNVPTYGAHSLRGFLTRGHASRHLRDLRVYKPEERNIPAWLPCFQLMYNLRDLHFDDLLSNREFLQLLVRKEPRLLPSLEAVNICQIVWTHKELHDVIGDLCASRGREIVIDGQVGYIELGWIRD